MIPSAGSYVESSKRTLSMIDASVLKGLSAKL